MEIKVFSDLIDVLKELGNGIIQIKNIPAKERQRYFNLLHDTFSLLDSAILLVITRLGDILNIADEGKKAEFVRELRRLNNFDEWEQVNRDVRLCSNLRSASREMDSFWNRFMGRIVIRDTESLQTLIGGVLEGEGRLADFIGMALSELAQMAEKSEKSTGGLKKARKVVEQTRDALRKERQKLIESEVGFYQYI